MKKLSALLLVLALCLSLCACGDTKDISIYDLQKTMLAADSSLPEVKIASSSDTDGKTKFAYLSDLDYNKVSGYFLAYAADGMAYEIAVIALKDKSDLSDAEASLRTHLEGRVNLYKTYEPAQTERAENALIVTRNNCVALIMCDKPEAVKAAFEEFLK